MPCYKALVTAEPDLSMPLTTYELEIKAADARMAEMLAHQWFIDKRDRKWPEDVYEFLDRRLALNEMAA